MDTRGKTRLVAIVDDDDSMRSALHGLLQSADLPAQAFASAEEFLNSGQQHQISCLIADIRMPGMSGLELQAHLNADRCRIPIIFITSYDSDDVHIQAFQAGAAGLLCKPFCQESLFQAVRSALANQHDIQDES